MDTLTHFADEARPHITLCGQPWSAVIMTAVKARCEACVDSHVENTQWTFPLPEVVA